jgi:CO/xanthine dehydrogenase FAD-binding subunit
VRFLQPSTWAEALEMKAALPAALPIAGGTDVMVELNFGRRHPEAVLDLTGVAELDGWGRDGGALRVGAGVTYTRLIGDLGALLPGLGMASRAIASPQIRNRATVAGNLGTASPAGDALPPLLATGAEVEVESTRGRRRIPIGNFFTGPKRSVLQQDELIAAFRVRPAPGPQQFAKVGTRNAMVIAVCSFAIELDPAARRVGTGIGSAAPTPIVAGEAERFLEGVLDEDHLWESGRRLPEPALGRFGELVAAAARPIDDVRGTAAYRRHALGVIARRTAGWAWDEYRGEVG